jgi:flagellar assembly protein FliH
MSSLASSKSQRTAYQRWELDSFDVQQDEQAPEVVVLPSVTQLELLQLQAREQGYADGYREGTEQAATERQQLQQIVAALSEELQQFDQRVADELLGLALAISKQVVRQALKLHPELILTVINEVLVKLPLSHQRARLILHPDDAMIVRKNMGERLQQSNWDIFESGEMTRGGCRLDAIECEVDATLERRWQRVVDAIGSDNGWLD